MALSVDLDASAIVALFTDDPFTPAGKGAA
jgi:hypothetical protein